MEVLGGVMEYRRLVWGRLSSYKESHYDKLGTRKTIL